MRFPTFALLALLLLTSCQGLEQHSGQKISMTFLPENPGVSVTVVRQSAWKGKGGRDAFAAYRLQLTPEIEPTRRRVFLQWVDEYKKEQGGTGIPFDVLDYPGVAVFVSANDGVRVEKFSPISTKTVTVAW